MSVTIENHEAPTSQTYLDIPDFRLFGRRIAIRCNDGDDGDDKELNQYLVEAFSAVLREAFRAAFVF